MTQTVDYWYTQTWIRTYTGRKFYPLDPRTEDIDIRDIAHALSNVCRFTGHVRKFYSVAQHCVLLSLITEEKLPWGLLHDASEAYIADIARPIKHTDTFTKYREAELNLERAIFSWAGLETCKYGGICPTLCGVPDYVKEADTRMLYTERRDLLDGSVHEKCYPMIITPWTPEEAESAYLTRWIELGGSVQ